MQVGRKLIAAVTFLLAMCGSGIASATDLGAPERIRAAVASAFPGAPPITSVGPSPVAGLFEVVIGGEVLYVDASGEHLVQGAIISTKTRQNLTEARAQVLNRLDFGQLPLHQALKMVKGDGQRRIAVFSDPTCPHCKRFEREILPKLDNVTVYTFMYPILSAASASKVRAVWCARDRVASWSDLMQRDIEPMPAVAAMCDSQGVDAVVALGKAHRINGTPTIVFEDGSRAAGALPVEQMDARMRTAQGSTK